MRSAGSPAELEHRRVLAVDRIVDAGYCCEEVADFLTVDPRSVRRWRAAFDQHGLAGLLAKPVPGRPPKLDGAQEKIVHRWLSHKPTEFGFTTELWTALRLAQLIEHEWHVRFHPHYLAAWLRQRGYSPQKPGRVPRERDQRALQHWLATDWPRIQRHARQRHAALAFIDESGLLLAPLLRRTWAPRSETPQLIQRARHRDKVSVAAALWWPPQRDRLGLSFWMLVNGYYNNVGVAAFLGELLGSLGSPLVVVWDGGNMHKGDPINTLVDQAVGRLELERLPAYGSELMPVEQLWSWLKYSRLNNYAPHDVHELHHRANAELAAIRSYQPRLRSFFHASHLPLPRTLLT